MQLPFKAVVADCSYGEHREFKQGWMSSRSAMLALKPSHAWWHQVDELGSLWEVAHATPSGDWQAVQQGVPRRTYRDLVGTGSDGRSHGVDKSKRAVVVTTDLTLPEQSTVVLVTNLPGTRE